MIQASHVPCPDRSQQESALMKTLFYLFDLEGTLISKAFFSDVLIPYSRIHLKDFILKHHDDRSIGETLNDVKASLSKEQKSNLNLNDLIQILSYWIDTGKETPELSNIQAHIWDLGYSKNHFKADVYPDVKSFFLEILNSNAQIGIYSSYSIHAQKLIMGYSSAGDLTPLISYFYDTRIGEKKESTSYLNIACAAHVEPAKIHFFSDHAKELEAAKEAGLKVTEVQRSGNQYSRFESITDFSRLHIESLYSHRLE